VEDLKARFHDEKKMIKEVLKVLITFPRRLIINLANKWPFFGKLTFPFVSPISQPHGSLTVVWRQILRHI